jgi:glutamate dehydrogenase (NAD(P)+)
MVQIHSVIEPAIGLEGYLVIDSVANGMAFGGTRIDPSVTGDMVVELAQAMTLKLSGHGLPVGGAKAGLRGSPDDPRLLREWIPLFVERCRESLSDTVVLGKDMGATNEILDGLYEALGARQLDVVRRRTGSTACPDRIREMEGYRTHMTGLAVAWATSAAVGQRTSGLRVIIQGFGMVGAGSALRLADMGARIVGVSDRDKALVSMEGLPVAQLLSAKDEHGSIDVARCSFPHRVVPRDELLSQAADALVLAAGSYLIDVECAARIRCPVVIEGANMGLDAGARQVLHERGITVVPDVIANSSSAAMVGHQMASGNTIPADVLWSRIRTAIEDNVAVTLDTAKVLGIDSRSAFVHVIGQQHHR